MNRLFKLFAFITLFAAATPAIAQMNIGHLNTDTLLIQMPEYKTAMDELARLEKQYNDEIKEMQNELQSRATALEANTAGWTALRVQKEQQELQTMYQNMQQYAQQAEGDLRKKEQELLTPVIQKLQDAVNAVGDEKGLDYILDSSAARGVVIFKKNSRSISNEVKARLGLI